MHLQAFCPRLVLIGAFFFLPSASRLSLASPIRRRVRRRRAGKHWEMSSPGIRRVRSFLWGAVQRRWASISTQTERSGAGGALSSLQRSLAGGPAASRGVHTQRGPRQEVRLRHVRPGFPHQVLPQQASAQSSQGPEGPQGQEGPQGPQGPGRVRVGFKRAQPVLDLPFLPAAEHVPARVVRLPDRPVCVRLLAGGGRRRSEWIGLRNQVTRLLNIFSLPFSRFRTKPGGPQTMRCVWE